jgi:hypothetical protein
MSLLTVGDYVATVGELAADPAVQESVANAIAARVGESMRGENPTATEAVLAGAAASRTCGERISARFTRS